MIDAFVIKPALMASQKSMRRIESLFSPNSVVLTGSNYAEITIAISQLEAMDSVRVIACGGDGTVHWAVNSLVGTRASLAVVPMGTGNDFARALGIRRFEDGVSVLVDGEVSGIDSGFIELHTGEKRRFVGVASCGFDAQVNERANHYPGPQGTAKYVAAIFGELRQLRARDLKIDVDGVVQHGRYSLVAIGNTPSYGGGMRICPNAQLSDGKLEATFVAEVNRRTLVRVLPRVFNGSHIRHPKVAVTTLSEIDIHGESFPIYADGERVGLGPASIKIHPLSVSVWRAKASDAT